MIDLTLIVHYANIMLVGILGSLGCGIGGGLTSIASLEAINIQPQAKGEITRASIIGLALIETAAILALISTFMIFTTKEVTFYKVIAECGITLAVGITAFTAGIVSSYPVQKACYSIARQPFFSQQISNLMLITQTLIQASIIFGFLIGLFISLQLPTVKTLAHGVILASGGLALGLGAIGPTIGLGKFAQQACMAVSINRKAYNQILPFVFLSEAVIETPLIFAFLIALIITFIGPAKGEDPLTVVRIFAAAIAIGIGTFSPGISSSITASSACHQIAYNPQQYPILSQTSLFGQGLIDAAAIYALLISLAILYF
jgi:F-type H+-transporting ATPase subunit c